MTTMGITTPAAMAVVFEAPEELDVEPADVVDVSVGDVVVALAAGDAELVAVCVEALFAGCQRSNLRVFSRIIDIQTAVVDRPASTPRAQYPSNTASALDACAVATDESHEVMTAEDIS